MSNQIILKTALLLHLITLAMAVGITLANAVAFKQFWKLYDKNKEQGLSAFRAFSKLRTFGLIGLMFLIFSGITMLWLFQWTLAGQLWFKIKMLLVVLIFVNGFTMGRIQNLKLEKLLSEESKPDELQPDITKLRRNLQIFNLTQLALFVLIIILSVFRFN